MAHASPDVEHDGGYAGELLLLQWRREQNEEECREAAHEITDCSGYNVELFGEKYSKYC
jgi:hypothetical protein